MNIEQQVVDERWNKMLLDITVEKDDDGEGDGHADGDDVDDADQFRDHHGER